METPLVEEAAKRAFDGIWEQVAYVWDYKDNLHNLKTRIEALKRARARVLNDVDAATKRLEEIEEDVDSWLKSADEEISKAEQILEDDQGARNRCCVSVKSRHKFSRRAKLESPTIEGLTTRAQFPRVGNPVPPRGLVPCSGYQSFESREGIVESIMQALKDDDAKVTGIWGLAGVGKTTLAKKVEERARAEGISSKVAFTTVTHKPDLRKIQRDIADWLNFKIELEEIEARARLLHDRLKLEKNVLIILDDVWEQVGLDSIGIPRGGDKNFCKVLLTSRDRQVLLDMGACKECCFQLDALTEDEARKLFYAIVGSLQDPHMEDVASEIVQRCAGLPVLVLPVATALKSKESCEWEYALEQLKKFDGEGAEAQAFAALKLSYSSLKQDQKSLFLLCGLTKLYTTISVSYLLRYGMGLGLFGPSKTSVARTRRKMFKLLNDLKSSSLLLQTDEKEFVRIHDVVYNFAISILSKEHNAIIKPSGSTLENWPEKHVLKTFTRISLPYCKIPEHHIVLDCPKLEMFHISGSSQEIPDNFFEGMKDLKVLDLTKKNLSPLPTSLKFLENLQTLCLDDCCIGDDISHIGKLSKLNILSLRASEFEHLPREIGQLTRLQFLDLSCCQQLKLIAAGVLSSLTSLEELYMGGTSVEWHVTGQGSERNNANLDELMSLPNLTTLQLQIPEASILPKHFFTSKLERFRINIGDKWEWSEGYEASNMLKLQLNASNQLMEKVKILLKWTDDLQLDGLIKNVQNDLSELDNGGFSQLKHLHVQNNHELRYIINSSQRGPRIAFPRLESLWVENSKKLEKICNDPPFFKQSLSMLRELKVGSCDGLKKLIPSSWVRGLLSLEEIEITECKMLEGIVMEESQDEVIKFPRLRKLKLQNLPHFIGISFAKSKGSSNLHYGKSVATDSSSQVMSYDKCQASTSLFNEKSLVPNMEDLKLRSIPVQKIWSTPSQESYYPNKLACVVVEGCENLKYLFTSSMVDSLAQLKKLEVSNCKLIEELIIPSEEGKPLKVGRINLPKLESLKIKQLRVLSRVCTGNLFECRSLKELWIKDCPKMKTFVTNPSSLEHVVINNVGENMHWAFFDKKVVFPNLENLTISYMQSLRLIWHEELHQDSFCKLKELRIEHIPNLSKVFLSRMLRVLQNLEALYLDECESLLEIFDLHNMKIEKETNLPTLKKLKTLYLWNLPNLLQVSNGDPEGILSFQNLCKVGIFKCSSLKSLFPASIRREILQLEELRIISCSLEQVIAGEEVGSGDFRFEFPVLKILRLQKAPNLKSFYPGRCSIDCPSLNALSVSECPRLKLFKWGFSNLSDMEILGQLERQISEPVFSFEEVVPKLEWLSLNSEDNQMILQSQLPTIVSTKVQGLELCDFENDHADFPITLLERFPNIEEVIVRNCYFKDLFSHEILNEAKHARTLSRIRHLYLFLLPAMNNIWNRGSHLDFVLQNLQTLILCQCQCLKSLAPSSASFKSLTTLNVYTCPQMGSVLTLSTAKTLAQLREMRVSNCKMMREIVGLADEGDEAKFEIVFHKLRTLELVMLKSLTCFSENCTIKFPSLVEVIVSQCPNMEFFSRGHLSTPKLHTVWLSKEKDAERWKVDLNITIGQLHYDMKSQPQHITET